MANVVIRPAKAEDMKRVEEIAGEAWSGIHEVLRQLMGPGMHDVLRRNWREEKARDLNSHFQNHPERFLVAEAGGRVLGFVTFHIEAGGTLGVIGNNAVANAERGKGLGPAMYRRVLDLFRQQGCLYAQVDTGLDDGHAPARRAYEKIGFNVRIPHVTYYMALR